MIELKNYRYVYGLGWRVTLDCGCQIDTADFSPKEEERNEMMCPNIGVLKDDKHGWIKPSKVVKIRRIKL